MNTIQLQDLVLCKRALDDYSAIEAAMEQGRKENVKDRLFDLKAIFNNRGARSEFRRAHDSLPQTSADLSSFKSDLAASRMYVESYLRKLEEIVAAGS